MFWLRDFKVLWLGNHEMPTSCFLEAIDRLETMKGDVVRLILLVARRPFAYFGDVLDLEVLRFQKPISGTLGHWKYGAHVSTCKRRHWERRTATT